MENDKNIDRSISPKKPQNIHRKRLKYSKVNKSFGNKFIFNNEKKVSIFCGLKICN